MDSIQLEKRKRIMSRSIALGHCVCDPKKPCPCPLFKEQDVCECAGEKVPVTNTDVAIKLTDYVRSAGCASKIGKKDLKEILSTLPEITDPRVIIGQNAGDDAGVIVLNQDDKEALILTVDVFAPSVDDPFRFGQVAAANSLSDIYAMGGEPLSALSIIGFPIHLLPNQVMSDILKGGISKMEEAGIAVVGGHSINDEEIKCGFAVIGKCPVANIIRNTGAKAGDAIILTKPIGTGIVAFAAQVGRGSEESLGAINESMIALNKTAASSMKSYDVHAATDVTGYSLLGHMSEIVLNSKVSVELDFDAIPLFPEVKNLACQEVLPGAVERNREAVAPQMLDFTELTDAQQYILFSPETSGGLLVFLPDANADNFLKDLHNNGITVARKIGQVISSDDNGKIRVKTSQRDDYQAVELKREKPENTLDVGSDTGTQTGCCSSPPADSSSQDQGCCCSSDEDPGLTVSEEPGKQPTATPDSLQATESFSQYMASVMAPGAIGLKQKKLMALALSLVTKCDPCVKINYKAAVEAGATEKELAETIALGIAFGGASVGMFYNTIKHKL